MNLVYSQEIFRIPMLWIGGAVEHWQGLRIEKLGTQVDIPVTLLDISLDLGRSFPFGKDLLSEESNSFAFYTFNEGFAFITDSSTIYMIISLDGLLLKSGHDPEYAETAWKSISSGSV